MVHEQQELTGFVVRGVIDGRPSAACWRNGALEAEPELLRRAEVVVAMGDYFASEDEPGHVVMASLAGGGYDVMLTVMRAFTRVTSIELPVGDQLDGAGEGPVNKRSTSR